MLGHMQVYSQYVPGPALLFLAVTFSHPTALVERDLTADQEAQSPSTRASVSLVGISVEAEFRYDEICSDLKILFEHSI